ncbi:SpoIIE family protein phosphatase [bacterium]|nr:SpoIIE family protein phosphatase [bacterium]
MKDDKKLKYLLKRKEILSVIDFFRMVDFETQINFQGDIYFETQDFSQYQNHSVFNFDVMPDKNIELKLVSRGLYKDYIYQIGELLSTLFCSSGNIVDILETVARQWKIINFHTHITRKLGYFTSITESCSFILQELVSIIKVKRASILIEEKGEFLISSSIGLPESITQRKYLPITGFSGWVFTNGTSLIINSDKDIPDELKQQLITKQLKTHTFKTTFISEPIAVIPLEIQQKVLGVLNLTHKEDQTPFSSEDLKIIHSIATEIAIMVQTILLIEKVKESEKLKMEISLAEKIQKSILPKNFIDISPFSFYGKSIAPNRVGGDYFGYFQKNKTLFLLIADVSGHSFSSALLVNNFRSYLKAFVEQTEELSKLFLLLNRFICEEVGDSGRFITSVLLSLNLETGYIVYCNAGHNSPLLLRKNYSLEELPATGVPLGFFEDSEYEERSLVLDKGDLLFLFTDGLEETIDKNGVFFGKDRLIRVLKQKKNLSMESLVEEILNDVVIFSGNQLEDDLTAIALSYVSEEEDYEF